MNINWYPGHMAKAKRLIEENLKSVDMVAELVDARIPASSKNPDIDKLLAASNKPRIMILNKSDIADPAQNKRWVEYYISAGRRAILYNSKTSGGTSVFVRAVKEAYQNKIEQNIARGMAGRHIKIMTLGIPNVGKSTLINNLCGIQAAKAEDRPGVTRTKQWVSVCDGIDMLDMPGILWPKLDDKDAALRLALTGAIRDEILDVETLAVKLIEILRELYPEMLKARYKITQELPEDNYDTLCLIGRKRGFLISGGEIDTERAATVLLDEFRGCKIGKMTLEKAPEPIK
ncbi:MAG: ribosome biogenesis GTPase YlqF [Eubacteriales bacterium]